MAKVYWLVQGSYFSGLSLELPADPVLDLVTSALVRAGKLVPTHRVPELQGIRPHGLFCTHLCVRNSILWVVQSETQVRCDGDKTHALFSDWLLLLYWNRSDCASFQLLMLLLQKNKRLGNGRSLPACPDSTIPTSQNRASSRLSTFSHVRFLSPAITHP